MVSSVSLIDVLILTQTRTNGAPVTTGTARLAVLPRRM